MARITVSTETLVLLRGRLTAFRQVLKYLIFSSVRVTKFFAYICSKSFTDLQRVERLECATTMSY
jgi:hypothetical protein